MWKGPEVGPNYTNSLGLVTANARYLIDSQVPFRRVSRGLQAEASRPIVQRAAVVEAARIFIGRTGFAIAFHVIAIVFIIGSTPRF